MKFSVLMSVYEHDNPEFLDLALNSIWHEQTCRPDQIVLVQDGVLKEELSQLIANWKEKLDNFLIIVPLEVNKGLSNALQTGLTYCENELVARMDADDISSSDRFVRQLEFMKHNPNVSAVGGVAQEFNKLPGDLDRFRNLPLDSISIKRFAKFRNPLNHPSVMFRKSHVLQAGSYKEMPLFEDFYLWIRMLQKGYIIENLPEVILNFRIGNDMVGRRHGISYLKKELHFLKAAKKVGFINQSEFLISVIAKLPLRILPKKSLEFLYKKLLR